MIAVHRWNHAGRDTWKEVMELETSLSLSLYLALSLQSDSSPPSSSSPLIYSRFGFSRNALIAWTCHAETLQRGRRTSHLLIKGEMMSGARSYDLPTMLLKGTHGGESANENVIKKQGSEETRGQVLHWAGWINKIRFNNNCCNNMELFVIKRECDLWLYVYCLVLRVKKNTGIWTKKKNNHNLNN